MLLLFVVFILLNVYLFIRGWQALPQKAFVHILYAFLFVFASSAVFIAIFLGNHLPQWLSYILERIGGYWIILFIYILMGAFLADILRVANHFFGIFPDWVTEHYAQAKLYYFIGLMVMLVIISSIGFIHYANPRVTQISIALNKGETLEKDIKIVALTDIHLGNLVRKKRFARWVEVINRQNADVILIAGDTFDRDMQTVENQDLVSELRKLSATYGVFAVPGNHEYYAGLDRALAYLKKAGINVLRDSSVVIDNRLVVIGRDDITNHKRMPLKALLNGHHKNLPSVVIDHQPRGFNESAMENVDLHISGHTHHGQIFPINLVVSKIYELGYGYLQSGNTHFYVSSGIGLWGAPLRIGTRSEIVSIVLKQDGDLTSKK